MTPKIKRRLAITVLRCFAATLKSVRAFSHNFGQLVIETSKTLAHINAILARPEVKRALIIVITQLVMLVPSERELNNNPVNEASTGAEIAGATEISK